MEAGRVFNSEEGVWREGPITFYPTYKYHLGGHTYIGRGLQQMLCCMASECHPQVGGPVSIGRTNDGAQWSCSSMLLFFSPCLASIFNAGKFKSRVQPLSMPLFSLCWKSRLLLKAFIVSSHGLCSMSGVVAAASSRPDAVLPKAFNIMSGVVAAASSRLDAVLPKAFNLSWLVAAAVSSWPDAGLPPKASDVPSHGLVQCCMAWRKFAALGP
eukprot:1150340-Pelagomonas_calceolata.AAC.7